jgi:WD40 repeat protein
MKSSGDLVATGASMASRLSKHLLKKVVYCFLFSSLALFLQPITANAQTGTFSLTGSMTIAREGPTATLLSSGEVLLAGGCNSDCNYVALASAELYNPTTGTFSATGSMATARFDFFTATLLPNGKVLVAGGVDNSGAATASAELYDPTTGTFSATGSMTTGRYQYTATLLPSGKVLVAAGCSGNNGPCQLLASAELYDPTTGTFSATGSMTAGRAGHTATLLPNGKVLVAAGLDPNSGALASAELYDPTTGAFSATGSMITARYIHTATLLPNGQVLVAAGYNSGALASAELYDPTTGTFSATGSMTTARYYHAATLLPNGKVLVAGGSSGTAALASAELYNPVTGTFSATGSMTTARYVHTATALPNGQVLVAGGDGNSGPLASAELYTISRGHTQPHR